MKKAKVLVLFLLVIFAATLTYAAENIIFSGTPIVKISEGGIDRVVENIEGKRAMELRCVISKIGKKYYWTTRENTEMVKRVSGAYVTYLARSGSGYVRIIREDMKKIISLPGDPNAKFDYVEHLLIGLNSITYYGTVTK